MKILSVIGQKGGTGKTTIATGIAVQATRQGRNVAIIDLDPQCNAAKWSDRRSKKSQLTKEKGATDES